MSNASSNIALFGLIGALIGTVPGVLGVLFTWLKSRDAVTRSIKNIELAKIDVEFTSAWVAAVSSVADEEMLQARKEFALARLDKLMRLAEIDTAERAVESLEIEASPKKAPKPLVFYIYSGFFFFVLFGASIDEQDNVSLSYFITDITTGDGLYGFAFLSVIWVVFLVQHIRSKRKYRNKRIRAAIEDTAN